MFYERFGLNSEVACDRLAGAGFVRRYHMEWLDAAERIGVEGTLGFRKYAHGSSRRLLRRDAGD